jgi:CheY-like chemotaxis protein
MSGLEVLRWVREQRRLRELPVILYVGSTPAHEQDAYHDLRVTAVVEKESSCHTLVDRVRDILHGEPVGK